MPILSNALPAQTAGGADSTTMVGTAELTDASGVGVTRIVLTPPAGFATVTGVATNNVTFTFRQMRANVSVGTIGAVTLTSGNNLVAETPLAVPLSGAPSMQQDDTIDVVMHQNGTGLAVGAGVIAVVNIS